MTGPAFHAQEPNVVPPDAAALIRAIVFEERNRPAIVPLEVAAKIVAAGHGTWFEERRRTSLVNTWVKQVFRRLRKHGWLEPGGEAEWTPTAALRTCTDAGKLAGKAWTERRPPQVAAPEPKRPPTPTPPRVESWPDFIQWWVASRRGARFDLLDLVGDMIRAGFGTGVPRERLEAAKRLAEEEIGKVRERDGKQRAELAPRPQAPPPQPPPATRPARPQQPLQPRVAPTPPRPTSVAPTNPPPQRSRPPMPDDLELLLAAIREKHAAAHREAEFYRRMLQEVEAVTGKTGAVATPVAAGKPVPPPKTATPSPSAARNQRRRATPTKSTISAGDAILSLLAEEKSGLKGGEIAKRVAAAHGFKPNSLRTTLYVLRKDGKVVQGEDGFYRLA